MNKTRLKHIQLRYKKQMSSTTNTTPSRRIYDVNASANFGNYDNSQMHEEEEEEEDM